jgi:hypothetical protein
MICLIISVTENAVNAPTNGPKRRFTLRLEVIANALTREEALAKMQAALRVAQLSDDIPVEHPISLVGLTCNGYVHPDSHVRTCLPPPANTILVWRLLKFPEQEGLPAPEKPIPAWLAIPDSVDYSKVLDIEIATGPHGQITHAGGHQTEFDGVVEETEEDLLEDELAVEHPEVLKPGDRVPVGTLIWNDDPEEWHVLS